MPFPFVCGHHGPGISCARLPLPIEFAFAVHIPLSRFLPTGAVPAFILPLILYVFVAASFLVVMPTGYLTPIGFIMELTGYTVIG